MTSATPTNLVRLRRLGGAVGVGESLRQEEFRRATREAEEALRAAGIFERNAALEREAEERRRSEERQREVSLLRGRGIALKHARVLVGELPSRDPVLNDRGEVIRLIALAMARRWGDSSALLLVLCGPKGCGKSFAAAEQVARRSGRSVPARLLIRHAWWWTKGRSPVTGIDQAELLTTPLLALDDVGQEAEEDRAKVLEVLDHLVCVRCDAGLETVITTNFSKATREQLDAHRRATSPDARAAALADTWEGYLGARRETVQARVVEYGAVIQCPDEDLRAEEREREVRRQQPRTKKPAPVA